jgi:hypothetical protein
MSLCHAIYDVGKLGFRIGAFRHLYEPLPSRTPLWQYRAKQGWVTLPHPTTPINLDRKIPATRTAGPIELSQNPPSTPSLATANQTTQPQNRPQKKINGGFAR